MDRDAFSDLIDAQKRLNWASSTLDMYDTREELPSSAQIDETIGYAEEAIALLRRHGTSHSAGDEEPDRGA